MYYFVFSFLLYLFCVHSSYDYKHTMLKIRDVATMQMFEKQSPDNQHKQKT